MNNLIFWSIAASVLALAYAALLALGIKRKDPGTERMMEVAGTIREGTLAFIIIEAKAIGIFVVLVAIIIASINHGLAKLEAVSFMVGAACSALACYLGLNISTFTNNRMTAAMKTGISAPFRLAFNGGSAMGLGVSGLAIAGLGLIFAIFSSTIGFELEPLRDLTLPVISGFALGVSSVALFARISGGIFTKAADVGSEIIRKFDAGIPEDDIYNPAVITDKVGSNVGGVCGTGADLFASYVGVIISAMVIAASGGIGAVSLPLAIAAIGLISSMLGMPFARTKTNPRSALNRGIFVSGLIFIVGSFFVVRWIIPHGIIINGLFVSGIQAWGSVTAGLAAGIAMALVTEYYSTKGPVKEIVDAARSGPAGAVIAGIAVGKRSTFWPLLLMGISIIAGYQSAGILGITLTGLGIMGTVGMHIAFDIFGPIADNAKEIAKMSHLGPEAINNAEILNYAGNTTAAVSNGFSIGSAALAAVALFAAFRTQTGLHQLDITRPEVMLGMLIGAALPFAFTAMTIRGVGRATNVFVAEVKRQFREIAGLLDSKSRADFAQCARVTTGISIKRLIKPGLVAIFAPVVLGFASKLIWDDAGMLGGFLIGATISGVLMAVYMANAGSAWGAARRLIEEEPRDDELGTGKGSARHIAVAIGDEIGDPFKDTLGPALNAIIVFMCALSLALAPLLK